MTSGLVTGANLGADFDVGVQVAGKLNIVPATTSTLGKMRFGTPAEILAGTAGVAADGAQLVVSSPTPTSPAVRAHTTKLWQDLPNFRDWLGYDDTGTHDMQPITQDCLNQSRTANRPCEAGVGQFLLGSPVTTWGGRLVFRGQGVQPTYTVSTTSTPSPIGVGTVFHIAHAGVGFNLYGYGSASGPTGFTYGNVFEGIATYRDQPAPGSGWTPGNFDFDFSVNSMAVDLDVYFHNATKGLKLYAASQSNLRRVRGQSFVNGVIVDLASDTIPGGKVKIYPWYSQQPDVLSYQALNGIALQTFRADGLHLRNLFAILQNVGWQVSTEPNGAPISGTSYLARADVGYFDSCLNGLKVDSSASGATLSFGSLICQPPNQYGATAGECVDIEGANCEVHADHFFSHYASASHVIVNGAGSSFSCGKANVGSWSMATGRGSDPAFFCGANSSLSIGRYSYSADANTAGQSQATADLSKPWAQGPVYFEHINPATVGNAQRAAAGSNCFFTNGCKIGEASGSGTGTLAYLSQNGSWYRASDETVVAA